MPFVTTWTDVVINYVAMTTYPTDRSHRSTEKVVSPMWSGFKANTQAVLVSVLLLIYICFL